ncbi:MAG: CBS domain-containing protein [Alphaproteobacteria bacterium]|nr:CBS domain-containing protein [Alphaproteobacteria bacterium]
MTTMLVEEIMCEDVEYVPSSMTLAEAARCMKERDCGFLPIGDDPNGKLQGVVTDRDIVIRGVAEGCDVDSSTVTDVKTDRVLYCFRNDDLRDVAYSMREKQVSRLIVLEDSHNKRLCGVVSLGDILRRCDDIELGGETARDIKSAA